MRFFVEVTPIGKAEMQSYCVEAESWQKALQAARMMRNDAGPISGFSIELAEEGCRAVDPMARLRYVVRKAPANAPLTPGAPAQILSVPPAAGAAPSVAPASAGHAVASAKPGSRTVQYASTGAAAVAAAPVVAPVAKPAPVVVAPAPPASGPKPIPDEAKTMPSLPPDEEEGLHVIYRREQEPTPTSPLHYREDVFAVAPGTSEADAERILRAQLQIIQDALKAKRSAKYVNLAVFDQVFEGRPPVPPLVTLSWKDWKGPEPVLTYPRRPARPVVLPATTQPSSVAGPAARAAAFQSGVPNSAPAVPRAAAVARPVSTPPGAPLPAVSVHPIYNASEPPPAGPAPAGAAPAGIAALGNAIAKASQPPPAPPAPPRPGGAPPSGIAALHDAIHRATSNHPSAGPAPAAPVIPPNPAPVFGAPPVAAPHAPPPVIAAPHAPPPVVAAPPPVVAAPPPVATPVAPPPMAAAPTPPPAPVVPTEPMRPRASSRPPSVGGARVRGDEIIAVLFEEMHDLHFARDSIEGGDFCLGLLLDKLPSRGGLIHFYDLTSREYVVVCGAGAGAEKLLLRRHAPSDPLLAAAMRKRGAVVINDAATNDAAFVERFEALGGARSVMIAPIMLGGRALGAIEIINALDGGPYSDDEGHALQYMAEQLAEFVSSHGLVLDPARIQKQRQPSAPPPHN